MGWRRSGACSTWPSPAPSRELYLAYARAGARCSEPRPPTVGRSRSLDEIPAESATDREWRVAGGSASAPGVSVGAPARAGARSAGAPRRAGRAALRRRRERPREDISHGREDVRARGLSASRASSRSVEPGGGDRRALRRRRFRTQADGRVRAGQPPLSDRPPRSISTVRMHSSGGASRHPMLDVPGAACASACVVWHPPSRRTPVRHLFLVNPYDPLCDSHDHRRQSWHRRARAGGGRRGRTCGPVRRPAARRAWRRCSSATIRRRRSTLPASSGQARRRGCRRSTCACRRTRRTSRSRSGCDELAEERGCQRDPAACCWCRSRSTAGR